MDWLHHIFQKSPEIALFLSLAAGYFIGQINFGKFQLGGVGGSLIRRSPGGWRRANQGGSGRRK